MWNIASLDEGIYLTVSSMVSKGQILYKDVYESHPPLIFFINSLVIKLVGQQIHYFRFFNILLLAMSAYLIYKIINVLDKKTSISTTAISGGLIFSFFSSIPNYEGFLILTESYLIFFQLLGIYILLRALNSSNSKLFLLTGIFLGLSVLSRQTALIFLFFIFIFLIFNRVKNNVSNKNISLLILGILIPFLIIGIYFFINGSLKQFLYWNTAENINNGQIDEKYKIEWFLDIFIPALPLWFLVLYLVLHELGIKISNSLRAKSINKIKIIETEKNIKYKDIDKGVKDKGIIDNIKDKNNIIDKNRICIFILIWAISLYIINLKFSIIPGFHHEYRETLIALSIISPIGLNKLINYSARNRFITIGKSIFILILTLSTYASAKNTYDQISDIKNFELSSNDIYFIKLISDNIKYCEGNIYVYETKWPKISLEIYFVANRYPEIKRYFYFPPDINEEQRVEFTQMKNTTCVAVIGERPPFEEAKNMYDYIITHYTPDKFLGYYSPYKFLSQQPVTIYKKLDPDLVKSKDVKIFNMEDAPIAISNKTAIQKNDIKIKYIFTGEEKWFTMIFNFKKDLDLKNKKFLLKLNITDSYNNNFLQIDLVDKKKNWNRYEKKIINDTIFLFLNKDNFGNGIDYQNVSKIHISIGNYEKNKKIEGEINLNEIKIIEI